MINLLSFIRVINRFISRGIQENSDYCQVKNWFWYKIIIIIFEDGKRIIKSTRKVQPRNGLVEYFFSYSGDGRWNEKSNLDIIKRIRDWDVDELNISTSSVSRLQ